MAKNQMATCNCIGFARSLVIMQKNVDLGIGGITTPKQERFVQMEINIVLRKNGSYMPSSLGGRPISVGRQAVLSPAKNFAI